MKLILRSTAFCLSLLCCLSHATDISTDRSAFSSAALSVAGFVLPVAAAAGCLTGTYFLGAKKLTPTQTKVALGASVIPVFGIGSILYNAAWEARESSSYFDCPFYEGVMAGALFAKWCGLLTPLAVLGWSFLKK